jgi:adenylate kinase family enzyme
LQLEQHIADDESDESDEIIGPQIDFLNNDNPRVVLVIGGPGSSKAKRVQSCLSDFPKWRMISVGRLLWNLLRDQEEHDEKTRLIGRLMRQGELVPQDVVADMVIKTIKEDKSNAVGFLVTGFPRDIVQAQRFEEQVKRLFKVRSDKLNHIIYSFRWACNLQLY